MSVMLSSSIARGRLAGELPTVRSMPVAWQRLLAALQRVRYGRIHRLRVIDGEPDLRDGLQWTRTVKIGGENDPHPGRQVADYVLRRECVELVRLLVSIGQGEILNLEVRNGLPFVFEVQESVLA